MTGVASLALLGLLLPGEAMGQAVTTGLIDGCYEIELLAWYEHPMTRERGPYAEESEDYHGIPEVVRIREDEAGQLDVSTVAPENVQSSWGAELQGDTLVLSWPRTALIWGLRYELVPGVEALIGVTWYWSHVLKDPEYQPKFVPTVWRPVDCNTWLGLGEG
jgi:hypothetical protein